MTIKNVSSDDIFKDAQEIIEQTRGNAYQAINVATIQRNWLLGKRIADEELKGKKRAEYGKEIVKKLAEFLTNKYGKGFDFSSLYKYVRFYKEFPEILDLSSPKFYLLSWTHYRSLLRVSSTYTQIWEISILTLYFTIIF